MNPFLTFLKKNLDLVGLFSLGWVILGYAAMYWVSCLPLGKRAWPYLFLYFFLLLASFVIAYLNMKLKFTLEKKIFLSSVFIILLLLLAIPFTSHDAVRYLWDGKVLLEGFDPYRTSPSQFQKDFFGSWPEVRDCREFRTLYPPLAQAFFAFCALFGEKNSFYVWKLILTLFFIGALILVRSLLRRNSLELFFPLVVLSPILLLETGLGAHVDLILGFFILLAFIFFESKNFLLSGLCLGLGFCTKFLPVFTLLPCVIYLFCFKRKCDALYFGFGFFAPVFCIYGVTLALGFHPFGDILAFFERLEFGSPIFSTLKIFLNFNQIFYLTIFLAFFLPCLFTFKTKKWEVGFVLGLFVPVFFSPVVYPWYFLPLSFCLPFFPSFFIFFWMSFSVLTYEVMDHFDLTGVWKPQLWPLLVQSSVGMLGLILDCILFKKIYLLKARARGETYNQ